MKILRIIDVIFSSMLIIILLPVFLVVSLLLSVTGERHIIYRQQRVGRFGQTFSMYKFVTMHSDSPDKLSGLITFSNDPRVTVVGRVLRKTKVNELPQLLNIVRGDLSFVGWRPIPFAYFDKKLMTEYPDLFKYRPGLTSCATLLFRDEEEFYTRNDISEESDKELVLPFKLETDERFLNSMGIFIYFYILYHTAIVIFKPLKCKQQLMAYIDNTKIKGTILQDYINDL